MFCSDWWFLTNDLGELVSNKLPDAVTHCRRAKISCAVFFKTSLPWKIDLFSHSIGKHCLQVGTIFFPTKVHYCSFDILKSELWVCMFPTGFWVILPVVYRVFPSFSSCFSFWCYFYWCHWCTTVLCCSSAQKIGKLIFYAVSCLFRHFAWFITSQLHCHWFSSPFHWLPVVRCLAYKSLKSHLCTSVTR
jgi:hypothetical protein